MIAWRLQEQAFGGLDRENLRFLDGLARHGGLPRRRLKPGTVLVREYHGQRHTVTVAADGFEWQGTTYASLSAIARAITGTAWSGPRFFALRPNGAPTRSNNKKSMRGSRDGSHPLHWLAAAHGAGLFCRRGTAKSPLISAKRVLHKGCCSAGCSALSSH
jgi:Protein of unknown function (DUF2924)